MSCILGDLKIMKNGLEKQYELVLENENKGTVNASGLAKPGGSALEDDDKKAKGLGIDSPAAKGVKSPEEMPKDLNPGHGTDKKNKELGKMLPESKFETLFKSTLMEDAFGADDENPLEAEGEGEFNDEQGDFPPAEEGDIDEEVDVATELRMIIDRLSEIAEKMGAFDGDEEEEFSDDDAEMDMVDSDLEGEEPVPESVTYGKDGGGSAGGPGKGTDGKLQNFPNKAASVQSKGGMKVKHSAVSSKQTAKGQASAGGPGKDNDGKLRPFANKASQAQSKGNMKVNPKSGKVGQSIFD